MDWNKLSVGLSNMALGGMGKLDLAAQQDRVRALDQNDQQLQFQQANATAQRAQSDLEQQRNIQEQQRHQQAQIEFLKQLEQIQQINRLAQMGQQHTNTLGVLDKQQGFQRDERIGGEKFRYDTDKLDHTRRKELIGLQGQQAMDLTMAPRKFEFDNDPMNQPLGVEAAVAIGDPSLIGLTPRELMAWGQAGVGLELAQNPGFSKSFGNSMTMGPFYDARREQIEREGQSLDAVLEAIRNGGRSATQGSALSPQGPRPILSRPGRF